MNPENRKVLHLINGEHYSGTERVQDLLAINLPEYGYEAWMACVKPGRFSTACSMEKSKIVEFPMNSRFDLRQGIAVGNFISKHNFSIVHTHTPRSALLGLVASRRSRIPLVHHLHSPTASDTEHGLRNSINAMVETSVMKRANHVIAVSSSLAEYLQNKKIKSSKFTVILNGVDSAGEYAERHLDTSKITLGVVALFRPRKGLEVLLKALKLLNEKTDRFQLRAVGPFETEQYRMDTMALVDELGISQMIEWTGFVQDVNPEFLNMDILTLPSLYGEGLPMVILEAMANGVPVIASRIEGVPDAIPDENFGVLVDPGNELQLAEKIRALADAPDHWTNIRKNAHIRQRDCLSATAMSKGVASIYNNILDS